MYITLLLEYMWVVQVKFKPFMSLDSSSIEIEVYNNGKTLRLLKLVFFTYKGASILLN